MYSTVRLTIEIFLEIRRYACTWWVYTSRGSSVTWNTGLWILVRYYARYVSEPPVALDFGTINGIHVRWIHTSMARRFASNVNELIYVDVSYIAVQVGRLEFRNPSSQSQNQEEFCRYVVDFQLLLTYFPSSSWDVSYNVIYLLNLRQSVVVNRDLETVAGI